MRVGDDKHEEEVSPLLGPPTKNTEGGIKGEVRVQSAQLEYKYLDE